MKDTFDTIVEKIELKGGEVLTKVKELIEEGNVRRVTIKSDDKELASFNLTVGATTGLALVVFAPILAAVGAIAALLTNCTLEIERTQPADQAETEGPDKSAGE